MNWRGIGGTTVGHATRQQQKHLCRAETPLTENYVVQVSSMHPTLSQDAVKDDVVNNCTANIVTTLNDLFSAVNESRQFEHLGKYFNTGQKNEKCRLS